MEDRTLGQQVAGIQKPKSKLIWLWIVLIVVILSAGGYLIYGRFKKTGSGNIQKDAKGIATVADANNYFGLNVFNKLLSKEEKNLFISPMSLSLALSWVANGADGSTRAEIMNVLGQTGLDIEKVNLENKKIITGFEGGERKSKQTSGLWQATPTTFYIADSLWTDKVYSFLSPFLTLSENFYRANAQSLDFGDPESLKTINKWVSDRTMGKIPTILDQLQSDMYLINTIYFKSSWAIPFLESATKDEAFTIKNGSSKNVPMMTNTDDYLYSDSKDLQIISLPYEGDYSMIVFLPKKEKDVDQFINDMIFSDYSKYVDSLKSQKGKVKLPKFEINYGGSIIKEMKELGLNISISGAANFSKLSASPTFINEIVHKTFISTDEKGTEAAAATAIGMEASANISKSPPKIFEFTADHPFFFTIQDNATKSIIFMGVVKDPTDKGSQSTAG